VLTGVGRGERKRDAELRDEGKKGQVMSDIQYYGNCRRPPRASGLRGNPTKRGKKREKKTRLG